MADISGYLKNIREASRGEDVRDTIIKALDTINRDNPITLEPLSVTANGTYNAKGGRGFSSVTVLVPEGATNAITLNDTKITENGTFRPDEGEAFSSVVVEVPQYVNEVMPETKEIVYEGDKSYFALDDGFDGYSAIHIIDPTSGGPGGGGAVFTVTFQNADGSHLQTKTGVPFGGGATFEGPLPTSPGMRFVGWNPNPINVKTNMVCRAVFENITWDVDEIADDWLTIARNCEQNYNYYDVGKWKLLEVGPSNARELVKMQLVGKRVDGMEGSNGYANTTWLAMNVLNDQRRFQDSSNGTWAESEIRSWLSGEFTQSWFPQDLLQYVKRVKKYTYSLYLGELVNNYATVDWFWIPSNGEIGIGTYSDAADYRYESSGPVYDKFAYNPQTMAETTVNNDIAKAIRNFQTYSGTRNDWYTRSRNAIGSGYAISYCGNTGEFNQGGSPASQRSILLGFCL